MKFKLLAQSEQQMVLSIHSLLCSHIYEHTLMLSNVTVNLFNVCNTLKKSSMCSNKGEKGSPWGLRQGCHPFLHPTSRS
jgi:hypothetical protein